MLSRLTEGGGLIGKATALGGPPRPAPADVLPRHRLQQSSSTRTWPARSRCPTAGNLTAVYTQNGNGSKVDVFQKRTINETVRLHDDGSARRAAYGQAGQRRPALHRRRPDPKIGYDTRWATNLVINLMPTGAKVLDSRPSSCAALPSSSGVDQDGRTYAQAAVMLPPGRHREADLDVRRPARRGGATADGCTCPTTSLPQSMLNARHAGPHGRRARTAGPPTRCRLAADASMGVRNQVPMDRAQVLKLLLTPRRGLARSGPRRQRS